MSFRMDGQEQYDKPPQVCFGEQWQETGRIFLVCDSMVCLPLFLS